MVEPIEGGFERRVNTPRTVHSELELLKTRMQVLHGAGIFPQSGSLQLKDEIVQFSRIALGFPILRAPFEERIPV